MEPSFSFVQHHEFHDVFLQQFSFNAKAKHHVEKSSGKKDRRRTCGIKIMTSMFGIKKPERESISQLGFGWFIQLGESRVGSEFCFNKRWETSAGKVQNPAASSQEWQRDDNPFSSAGTPVRVRVSVQAQGDLCEGSRTNLQGRSWTTTIYKSPTTNTLEKESSAEVESFGE